jgi:hypothetical protein
MNIDVTTLPVEVQTVISSFEGEGLMTMERVTDILNQRVQSVLDKQAIKSPEFITGVEYSEYVQELVQVMGTRNMFLSWVDSEKLEN